jgi:hypothetical protein
LDGIKCFTFELFVSFLSSNFMFRACFFPLQNLYVDIWDVSFFSVTVAYT